MLIINVINSGPTNLELISLGYSGFKFTSELYEKRSWLSIIKPRWGMSWEEQV